ncbi:MAG: hypothetical protein AB1642_06070 [Pseudomonadota bacterium]
MKIASTDLAMQSDHAALARRESSETLRAWRGERPDFEGMESAVANISQAARHLLAAVPPGLAFDAPEATADQAQAIESAEEAVAGDPVLSLVKSMIEMLTGEEVRVFDMQSFSANLRHVEARGEATGARQGANGAGRAGFGLEYDRHTLHEEFEETSFFAEGVVRTADGQEFRFKLDLQMTRHYREETHVSVRAGDAVRKDPLVVNFGGTAAQLAGRSGQHFLFDLDGDGRVENLPLFASGSGYLALDLDGNGRIDSGRELFGPGTGNGFDELARLDADGNGWIDANDTAFDSLSVWTPEAEGAGVLRSLDALGIGALGLPHVATPFALRDAGNGDLGAVRATGLYLTETGQAGSLQEIDLTI